MSAHSRSVLASARFLIECAGRFCCHERVLPGAV